MSFVPFLPNKGMSSTQILYIVVGRNFAPRRWSGDRLRWEAVRRTSWRAGKTPGMPPVLPAALFARLNGATVRASFFLFNFWRKGTRYSFLIYKKSPPPPNDLILVHVISIPLCTERARCKTDKPLRRLIILENWKYKNCENLKLMFTQRSLENELFYGRILGLRNWCISPLTIHRFHASLAPQ